jgi:hypothetical protein
MLRNNLLKLASFHFDADPYPDLAFQYDADPDPASQNDADPDQQRCQNPELVFADPDIQIHFKNKRFGLNF